MADKPVEEDLRVDDEEYNPSVEPKSAKAWLNLLRESEKAFEKWNDHCDNIDKLYANLDRLSNMGRDRQFSMFWANAEVIKPSIYAKPPIPVVVPKFKDRRPVYQAASEVMERCATVAFDLAHINDLMILVRDDVAMVGRGVAWCRYEGASSDYGYEKVCIDFKHRHDFLHSVSRNWREVSWVAGASYLTRSQARKRFKKHSGDAYQDAEYRVDKDAKEIGGADNRERAKFWEIWSRTESRVLWVAECCEVILDEDEPHLKLENFFPCPKPAYGTVQRGSLVPVPDVMQYKDQLDEVNTCTARIHALAEALEVKGFYPAGGAELGDAVQAAVQTHSPGRVLIPISNWAAFGGSKEVIIWMPIDVIAQTITAIVTLRKQIIDDIYQIMGLSDIMRGSTDPNETLGAQQLKTQYGSTRIRDKQQELVRLARDLVGLVSEIACEKFKPQTIIAMSQTQLPTQKMLQQQIANTEQAMQQQQQQFQQMQQMMQQAAQQAQQNPQMQQMLQQNKPQLQMVHQEFQKLQARGQETLKNLREKPTVEQVMKFLKDTRAKAFVLDIETDSTIQADENAEKQRRSEFVGVLGQLLPQLANMITAEPKTAEFCGELLKFSVAPFRASRTMDGSIDELIEQMKAKAAEPKPDPEEAKLKLMQQSEQQKLEYAKEKDKAELELKTAEMQQKDQHEKLRLQNDRQLKAMELAAKGRDDETKMVQANQKAISDREKHQADMIKTEQQMRLNNQKADLAEQSAYAKQQDMAARRDERAAQQQFKQQQPI